MPPHSARSQCQSTRKLTLVAPFIDWIAKTPQSSHTRSETGRIALQPHEGTDTPVCAMHVNRCEALLPMTVVADRHMRQGITENGPAPQEEEADVRQMYALVGSQSELRIVQEGSLPSHCSCWQFDLRAPYSILHGIILIPYQSAHTRSLNIAYLHCSIQ